MPFASCLNQSSAPLLLDASVLLNVNSTGIAKQIFRAVPNKIIVTVAVMTELERGAQLRGYQDASQLGSLISDQTIDLVDLSEKAMGTYYDLIAGPSVDTLDDGEAATVAFANEHPVWAVIDERKALRICRDSFPGVRTASSIDLFSHTGLTTALPHDALANAVFAALSKARMRVRHEEREWVVQLIGRTRANQCPSLPKPRCFDVA